MIYRPIGNTGMSAGIVGLGAEHLDNKPFEIVDKVINAAIDHDFNMIDIFMPGEKIRTDIGKALRGRRDKVLIQGHIGSTDVNQQYDQSRDIPTIKKYFKELLRFLNTDYIDFGMLFFIDSEQHFSDVFDTDFVRYAQDLKKQGHIRAIGASSHNPITAKKIVETGVIDLLMFSVSPAFDMIPASTYVFDFLEGKTPDVKMGLNEERASLYRLCEQKNVAITTMKTLGAGKLISPEHTPFAKPLTTAQCIHYALTRPAVVSALIGCSTVEHVKDVAAYLDMPESEKDYSSVICNYQGDFKGRCVYCNHCLPCPANINVAEVHKYLDIALLDEKNIPPGTMSHYKSMKNNGSSCTECASCESKCPFSVPVMANMRKAAAVFG